MNEQEPLRDLLHRQGRRLTAQRRLILQVLAESDGHLDAEAVHDRAKARDPRISLATVYRTLALLKKAGWVEEHRLGEGHGHFEVAPPSPHYHFTCQACGRVLEFDAPQVAEVIQDLVEREHLQVTSVHLLLSGLCEQCRKREAM